MRHKRARPIMSLVVLWAAALGSVPLVTAQTATTASAEDPKVSAALKLLDLTGYEQQLDFMFQTLNPLFAQSVIGMLQADPASKAMVDRLISQGKGGQARLTAILSEEFAKSVKLQYPSMKASAAREYAAVFSMDELEAMADFYRSPAGLKSLKVLPDLQRKIGAAGEQFGRVAGEEAGRKGFQRAIEEMLPEQGGKAKL